MTFVFGGQLKTLCRLEFLVLALRVRKALEVVCKVVYLYVRFGGYYPWGIEILKDVQKPIKVKSHMSK